MARPGVNEQIPFGVSRHAGNFADRYAVRVLQQAGNGIERDLRGLRGRLNGKEHHPGQNLHKAFHTSVPSHLAAAGFNNSFCTRQDSISATKISFGLRQSIM